MKNAIVSIEETKELVDVSMFEGAETGFEELDKNDFVIPMIGIIQSNSPELDDSDSKYIEGAKPGHIVNKGTQESFESIRVVPVYYKRREIEWLPDRGGFVAEHLPSDVEVKTLEDGLRINPVTGNELVTTAYFYCILVKDSGFEMAVIPMASTQLKIARSWITRSSAIKVQGKQAPLWSHIYKLSTVTNKNDRGSWKGWKVDIEGLVSKELFEAATAFRKSVLEGEAKVDHGQAVEKSDDEMPF